MLRELALIVHLIGLLLWVGGAAAAAWVAASVAHASGEARRAGLGAARRTILSLATPGLVLAWVGGLAILVDGWSALYARAGWMHGKLTLGILLAGITGLITGRIRKAVSGEREAGSGLLAGLAMALVLGAAIAVALVVLRPGA